MKTFLMIVLAIACIILIVSVFAPVRKQFRLVRFYSRRCGAAFRKKEKQRIRSYFGQNNDGSGDSFRSSVGSIGYDRLDRFLQSGQFLINYNIHL